MSHHPRMLYKITVLGDGGVGKTALTVQFTMSSFVETYDPTIEDCYRKQWVVDDQPCLLEVLDTAGQEEFTTLRDQWIRDGEGFIIVYSLTNRNTFERVEKIVERVYRVKEDAMHASSYEQNNAQPSRRGKIPIVIVGNKRDRPQEREVGQEEGLGLASSMGCGFFETSAKTNYNVEAAFKAVVRAIKIAKMGGASGGREPGARSGKKRKKCVIL